MKTAKEIYETLEKGILDIVKAADIYTLHLLASLRGAPAPPYDTIQRIMNGAVSVVSLVTLPYSDESRIKRDRFI